MPGRLFLTRPMAEVAAAFGQTQVPNDPPRRNIAPGQEVLTLTADGFRHMRWGIIPVGRRNARGRPVMETLINARSETVFDKSAYEGVGRAVIPADGWYEWTGKTRRKTAWSISASDESLLAFAAICDVWKAPGGLAVWQVAAVTCEPSADVRDVHHRMGVLLAAAEIPVWLTGTQDRAAALMRPWPDGALKVVPAEGVDWTAP